MVRRFLGALMCALLLGAATFDTFAETAQGSFAAVFEFETSFISRDSLDDSGDNGFPSRSINWSPRQKVIAKLMLDTTQRTIRFAPAKMADCDGVASSRQIFRDLFRFKEVYRI